MRGVVYWLGAWNSAGLADCDGREERHAAGLGHSSPGEVRGTHECIQDNVYSDMIQKCLVEERKPGREGNVNG